MAIVARSGVDEAGRRGTRTDCSRKPTKTATATVNISAIAVTVMMRMSLP